MGLDSVELLVEIEDQFEIEITNLEAEQIYTVGDCFEIILQKLKKQKIQEISRLDKCKSQKIFYKLRREVSDTQGYPFKLITPKTELEKIFRKQNRKQNWKLFSKQIDLKIPDLERPEWIEKLITRTGITLGIVIFLISICTLNWIFLILWMLLPFYWVLAFAITKKLANQIRLKDMRELVEGVLSLNYKTFEFLKTSKQGIFWMLRGIIAEKVGVPISEIKYEARIRDDLGID